MLLVSCETVPAGPSLSNVTFTPSIQTATGWKASQKPTVLDVNMKALDPTVCCCHVTGTITNGNSVPVHVILTFAAMTAQNTGVGAVPGATAPPQIVYFEKDLPAGASDTIEAPGFLFPCAAIDHVDYQLNVSSVGLPVL
jgi:hypothetical protein